MKFCPECGFKLIENAKFCPECGFKIDSIAIEEPMISESENTKVNSDEYIKTSLNNTNLSNVSVTPDISEKKLVNASVSIANNIDPNTIIGLIDTSMLSNGKAGVVFTGSEMYLKNNLDSSKRIPFKNILDVEYDSERNVTNRGKIIEYQKVTVNYQNGESLEFSSQQYDKEIPYKLLNNILTNFNDNVDVITSKNQILKLSQMSSSIIMLYFRIVIAYLKDDDGIIDSREYKELVSLMTKVKVTKEVAKELREYRFDNKEDKTIEELIDELKFHINEENLSEIAIEQSLGMDILGMNLDKLDNIQQDEVLVRMLNRLNITDKQLKFSIRKIEAEKEIIENKMTDSQIKDVAKELMALGSGAGISIGAFAVIGTAGIGLGGALILASAGFGVYRGIKYFSGTGQLEKYGIRIQTLNDRINQLRIANSYIIEDINWLSDKSVTFAKKLRESNELSEELYKELEHIISQNQSLADAGNLIEDEENYSEYELYITHMPETLNIGKYNELLSKNINKVYFDEVIKEVYIIEGDLDNTVEEVEPTLREDMSLDELKQAYQVLEQIGYYDTKSSSIAQGKSLAKKGFSGLKKSLLNGDKNV